MQLSFHREPRTHNLAIVFVAATTVHANMMQGVLGSYSKWLLSACIVVATIIAVFDILLRRVRGK